MNNRLPTSAAQLKKESCQQSKRFTGFALAGHRGRPREDADGDARTRFLVPHRATVGGYRSHGVSAAASHRARQTEVRVGDHAGSPFERLPRGHGRIGDLQGKVERTQGRGGEDGRVDGPVGRRGPGSRGNRAGAIRLDPNGGGNVARFKQLDPAGDTGFGLFEPYFRRRKPSHHKEKALRRFRRRAQF